MKITQEELNYLLDKAYKRGYTDAELITPNIIKEPIKNVYKDFKVTYIPSACIHCSKHLSNGGDGICHCTLGSMNITY